jgi:hypothetical protein
MCAPLRHPASGYLMLLLLLLGYVMAKRVPRFRFFPRVCAATSWSTQRAEHASPEHTLLTLLDLPPLKPRRQQL